MHVDLHAREVGLGVAVRAFEQLTDAGCAPVAEPVAAEEHREVRRCDAVIRVHQPPARRGDDMGQLVTGSPADPVMRAVARHWHGAVAGATDRHAAGNVERDALPVGHQQVLHRRGDHRGCLAGGVHIARLVEREQAGGRGVAWCQVGHRHGQDRAVAVGEVADHRSVAGLAHGQHLVGLAADLDPFLAHGERTRAVGSLVFAIAGRRFDEHVLHVGAGGGEGPGDVAVVAEDQERHAWGGGAGQHAVRCLDPRQVPDAGKAERQMRIAGEQRRAGRGVAAVHRPFVRSRFGQRVGGWEARQHGGEFARNMAERGRQRPLRAVPRWSPAATARRSTAAAHVRRVTDATARCAS